MQKVGQPAAQGAGRAGTAPPPLIYGKFKFSQKIGYTFFTAAGIVVLFDSMLRTRSNCVLHVPSHGKESSIMPLFAKPREPGTEEAAQALPSRRRKKWPYVLLAAVLVLGAASLLGRLSRSTGDAVLARTDTATLVRSDLRDTISATGTVESAQSMTVYSTMAYTVQEVYVEEGDYVEAGQLLCKLDDQNIQDQIESQQASLSASNGASAASITAARDSYEQFKYALENGLNTSIISAENAVTNAYNAYLTAQDTYQRYQDGLNAGENPTLLGQETALRTARNAVEAADQAYAAALEALDSADSAWDDAADALDDAEDALDDARSAAERAQTELTDKQEQLSTLQDQEAALQQQLSSSQDEAERAVLQQQLTDTQNRISTTNVELLSLQLQVSQLTSALTTAQSQLAQCQSALRQAEQAYDTCEAQVDTTRRSQEDAGEAYDTALLQYNATLTTVDNTLADYAKNVETAFQAYQAAQSSLEAARVSAQSQLQSYQNSLNSAYAGANKAVSEVSLRQLRADLESTEITAPTAGTVTAVYAKVGSSGSGLLFVIEDTEHFVVSTTIKDYDITAVGVGTAAAIQSDATGSDTYDGEITYIAPTANKTASGVTDTSGDISFAADVAVRSEDTRLRIGLSVRLNLIVEQAEQVLSVPYDAVYTDAQGQTCVLAAVEQAEGKLVLTVFPVTTGLETDLNIAVEGPGLEEGMTIVSEPEQYLSLVGRPVTIGAAQGKPMAALMGGM